MIEKAKGGKSIGLSSLENKLKIALKNKREIANRVNLLNNSYSKGEISNLEYNELLNNFKELNKTYALYKKSIWCYFDRTGSGHQYIYIHDALGQWDI